MPTPYLGIAAVQQVLNRQPPSDRGNIEAVSFVYIAKAVPIPVRPSEACSNNDEGPVDHSRSRAFSYCYCKF